jgi:hypothetical protein
MIGDKIRNVLLKRFMANMVVSDLTKVSANIINQYANPTSIKQIPKNIDTPIIPKNKAFILSFPCHNLQKLYHYRICT